MSAIEKQASKNNWNRSDKIGAAALIVGILGAIAAWLVFFVPPATPPPLYRTTPTPTASTSATNAQIQQRSVATPTPQTRIATPTPSVIPIPKPTISNLRDNNSGHSDAAAISSAGLSTQAINDRGYNYYMQGDFQQARQWYQVAANAGHPDAMYSLGRMYEEGQGMQPNYSEALNWYRKAIDAGSKDALYGLGHMYDNGEGVKPDHGQALQWFKKAAAGNCVPAMTALGLLYEFGPAGVQQDIPRAREWYEKAAQAGDKRAKQRLEQLSAK